jgi:hypothetical protein
MDPRDPLQLTDGVWGVLGRYYFLNNSNIWLWALHGNKELKGWESTKTLNSAPEIGGRIQHPAGRGEIAISYHYRKIDGTTISAINRTTPTTINRTTPTAINRTTSTAINRTTPTAIDRITSTAINRTTSTTTNKSKSATIPKTDGATEISDLQQINGIPGKIPEHRIGIDAKFDWIIGFWVEGSWTTMREDIGLATNQHLLNIGADYTFGVGNGLTVVYEHLLASFDQNAFQFKDPISFSALSASYPLALLDQLNTIFYFDWNNKSPYFFINWQRQFNKLTFNLMGYSNPKHYRIPSQNQALNLFAGNGIQLMLIYNH